jgi:hypothetical protein
MRFSNTNYEKGMRPHSELMPTLLNVDHTEVGLLMLDTATVLEGGVMGVSFGWRVGRKGGGAILSLNNSIDK